MIKAQQLKGLRKIGWNPNSGVNLSEAVQHLPQHSQFSKFTKIEFETMFPKKGDKPNHSH